MKIQEVKDLLKKYSKEELQIIITELYKAIPKKIKEEKNLDAIIEEVNQFIKKDKVEKKREDGVEINELTSEIQLFIENAYNQYYFIPNRVVPKKERPKWRFKVKGYFKTLEAYFGSENEERIIEMMKSLYEMLSYGCGYALFSTDNPFASVGLPQIELFDKVIAKRFSAGINQESIRFAIELMINSELDRETLYSDLMLEIIKHLKTTDSKEMAIRECRLQIKKIKSEKLPEKRAYYEHDLLRYRKQRKINNLVEISYRCCMVMCEFEEAIQYFKDDYIENDREIKLYVLLRLMFEYDLKECWHKEYEKALEEGINPRQGLQNMYKYLQDNRELPEYIF